MNIEGMIYVYMAVCTAMILFNCVMVLINGRQERNSKRSDNQMKTKICRQIQRLENGENVETEHLQWMKKRLMHLRNLRTFDMDMEIMQKSNPVEISSYLDAVCFLFQDISGYYCGRDNLKAAYFAYVVRKYNIMKRSSSEKLKKTMMGLLSSPNVYARENALHSIYGLGSPEDVVHALQILDKHRIFHHPKLIHDGLLEYSGNREKLLVVLWKEIEYFSYEMQTTLINYFRLSGGGCDEQVFSLMTKSGQNDEVYFACMRYFGRFFYSPVYPLLLENLRKGEEKRWELAAVAATVLRNYPGERTVDLLKQALHSSVWYVRANAAESLEALEVSYVDLATIFEGDDRYAREILQYRLDYRKAKEKEGIPV